MITDPRTEWKKAWSAIRRGWSGIDLQGRWLLRRKGDHWLDVIRRRAIMDPRSEGGPYRYARQAADCWSIRYRRSMILVDGRLQGVLRHAAAKKARANRPGVKS